MPFTPEFHCGIVSLSHTRRTVYSANAVGVSHSPDNSLIKGPQLAVRVFSSIYAGPM